MLMFRTDVFVAVPIQGTKMYRSKCAFECAGYTLSLRLIIYRSRESRELSKWFSIKQTSNCKKVLFAAGPLTIIRTLCLS